MKAQRNLGKLVIGTPDVPYELLVNPGLTKRQKEILENITLLDKVIAYNLNISIRTVVNHSVKIREKTGCRSKAELAEYATILKMVN